MNASTEPLTATTNSGPVIGRVHNAVLSFGGIPFAAPPVGAARFAAPLPVEPWTEPHDGRRFAKGSPQRPGEGLTSAVALPWDEAECLNLNVQTPALDGSRPVMVWIHGGDFHHGMGAIPWYNGTNFALNGDVVVVSINYRLGAFGFTALDHLSDDPSLVGSGAAGILDQIAALEWVQAEIANFGGDPTRVTIAGESAGAFSVGTLMTLPAAQPLFAQAILQSGAGHAVHTAEQGEGVAAWLLGETGIAADADAASALRALSADELLDAQEAVYAKPAHELNLTNSPFYPVVDGTTIPERPIDAMVSGAGADKPVLMGTNAEEMRLWGTHAVGEDRLEKMVGRVHPDAAATIERYRDTGRADTAGEVAVAIGSDSMFGVPALRMADARAQHDATTYLYRFSWKSRAFDGNLGACHALEIPFVFDNLAQPGVKEFIGEGPSPQSVADAMHRAWIAFMHDGVPEVTDGPAWPAYSSEDRQLVDFGNTSTVCADPVAATLDCWDGVR